MSRVESRTKTARGKARIFEIMAFLRALAPGGPTDLGEAMKQKDQAALATLRLPEVTSRLHAQGAEPWGTTPREAQAFLAAEVQRWTKAARMAAFNSR